MTQTPTPHPTHTYRCGEDIGSVAAFADDLLHAAHHFLYPILGAVYWAVTVNQRDKVSAPRFGVRVQRCVRHGHLWTQNALV